MNLKLSRLMKERVHLEVVIFKCIAKNGEEFDCTPEGTMEYKKELFRDRKKLIGKYLTVRYQTLMKRGVPIFPVV